jgi:hypothetical protein
MVAPNARWLGGETHLGDDYTYVTLGKVHGEREADWPAANH